MSQDALEAVDARPLIGGRRISATSGRVTRVVNPSTGDVVAEVPDGGAPDIGTAVEAAEAAQPRWASAGFRVRSQHLHDLAEAVSARREQLAIIDAIDSGNSLESTRGDVDAAIVQMSEWPGLAAGLCGSVVDASPGNLHYTRLSPFGVVGRIVAFNHPALFAMTRILPALVTGNTVVLKPAQQTPLSTLAFAGIVADVLPPGIVNIVPGGSETGDALVTHPRVRRLGFTGSVATGMHIAQRAAAVAIKHVSLELGGKNAMVVFPDVDIDKAVAGAHKGMNLEKCQGQSCGSTSRLFVHQDIYRSFVDKLASTFAAVPIAPALDPGAHMGPLISAEHRTRVLGLIESGRRQGATIATGGGRPKGLGGGFFVEPTVFADADMSMEIAAQEIFGPVVAVLPWSSYDHMIEQVNCTEFGLAASVWTNDIDLAHRTADVVEAGYVWINETSAHYRPMPFGGWKNSGLGTEEGIDELESNLRVKSVHAKLGGATEAFDRMRRRPTHDDSEIR